MASELYFGRYYKLVIKFPGGETKTYETKAGTPSMDIKFETTYARGQTAREGVISILGLSFKTIHQFLHLAAETRGKAMSEMINVKLDVGYFSEAGHLNILNGFVWYATVTSPPQMWLNLKVSEYNPLGGRKTTLGTVEIPIKDILDFIVKSFRPIEGKIITWVDKTKEKIVENGKDTKKVMFGANDISFADAIKVLNNNLSDTCQFILRSSGEKDVRIIEVHDKEETKHPDGEVKVDKNNGLLSVTGIDAVNGCITTFIDGRYEDELSHLNLTSELNQQANGIYYIIKKQYIGHFLGTEWYVRYFCSARKQDEDK